MNDTPPAYRPGPAPVQNSGGRTAACCGFGRLTALLVCVVGAILTWTFLKREVEKGVEEFTSTEGVEIAPPEVSEPQIRDAVRRFDTFRDAMRADEATPPLVLSDDDINAILFHHPDFAESAGVTRVSIEDNQLTSELSVDLESLDIPVEFFAERVKGRYFNGEITLSLGMIAGRPSLYVENLAVGGKPVPAFILKELRKENLLQEAASDPDFQKALEKVREVKIENDRLVIIPANPALQ